MSSEKIGGGRQGKVMVHHVTSRYKEVDSFELELDLKLKRRIYEQFIDVYLK